MRRMDQPAGRLIDGGRMSKLVGEELDRDQEFWFGEHGTWDSDEHDSGFSDQGRPTGRMEAGMVSAGSSDSADSDIDDSEGEDVDDGAEEDQIRKQEKRARVPDESTNGRRPAGWTGGSQSEKDELSRPSTKTEARCQQTVVGARSMRAAPAPKRKQPSAAERMAAVVAAGEGVSALVADRALRLWCQRSFRKSTVAVTGASAADREEKRQKQKEAAAKRVVCQLV